MRDEICQNFRNFRIKSGKIYLRKAVFAFHSFRWIAIFDANFANLFGFVNLTQSFRLKFQFCLSKTQENTSKSKCQYDKAMRTQHQEFKIMFKNLFDGIIKIETSCFLKILLYY